MDVDRENNIGFDGLFTAVKGKRSSFLLWSMVLLTAILLLLHIFLPYTKAPDMLLNGILYLLSALLGMDILLAVLFWNTYAVKRRPPMVKTCGECQLAEGQLIRPCVNAAEKAAYPFHTVLNSIKVGLLIVSPNEDLTILHVNPGFLSLVDHTRDELKKTFSNSLSALLHEDDATEILRDAIQKLDKSEHVTLECRLCCKNKEPIWVIIKAMRAVGYDKPYYCCVITDITLCKSIEQDLRISEMRYKIAMEQSDLCMFDYDAMTDTLFLTKETAASLGIPSILSHPFNILTDSGILQPPCREDCLQALEQIRAGATCVRTMLHIRMPDGAELWCKCTLTSILSSTGKPVRTIGIVANITEQMVTLRQLKKEEKYQEALVGNAMRTYRVNLTKNLLIRGPTDFGQDMPITLGSTFDHVIEALAEYAVHPDDKKKVHDSFQRERLLVLYAQGTTEFSLDCRRIYPDGRTLWICCTLCLMSDPFTQDVKGICYIKDIQRQKERELKLLYCAEHDSLCNLYNKRTTKERISEFLALETNKNAQHALLILDIDNFKQINDEYGHIVGDTVLTKASGHIRDCFRSSDIVGRVGGDEFVLFIKNISRPEAAARKARELKELLHAVHINNNPSLPLSASIGIAIYPAHGEDFDILYQNADTALYQAKKSGKDTYCEYSMAFDTVFR